MTNPTKTGDEPNSGDRMADVEEDDETYRRRVYGTADNVYPDTLMDSSSSAGRRRKGGSFRRLSRQLSRSLIKRSSSVLESLPETPAGWTVLVCAALSAVLGYELQLQRSLTGPPITFGQLPPGSLMEKVYQKLTKFPDSILSRSIQPSLFVGTRGIVSSTAAYLNGGPYDEKHLRFREVLTMPQDGARIAIDWEVPLERTTAGTSLSSSLVEETKKEDDFKREILKGPIRRPVVIILHGINNDASFGYMKSLQRTFCNRGWNAASMNFRGCGGISMTTPRGYNGAYTGDLRGVVNHIAGRIAEDTPIFLVGNSLGANIMTKYLGEEGMAGTLPKCVTSAASLGNPLLIDSSIVRFPFNVMMGLGIKKIYIENWKSVHGMKDANSKRSFRNGLLAPTVAKFDQSVAPIFIRNDSFYPFGVKVGYKDGNAYWFDASSYRYTRYISIPFLNLTAQDDFLVSRPSRNKLGYCLANPNIMVVETRCGGHLGWQETPPDSAFGTLSSWADTASADFFEAVMQSNEESFGATVSPGATEESFSSSSIEGLDHDLQQLKTEAKAFTRTIHSRL